MKDLLLGKASLYEIQTSFYNSLSGHKYGGYYEFTTPSFMVRDPDMVERILIKDFNYFMDRGIPPSCEDDIFTLNLANAEGEHWRALRYKLTPTFTSGKLKGMFEQINRASSDLIRYIDDESVKSGDQLEGKPLMNRFAMDVIATCAFGIQFSYHDKERDRFLLMVRKLFSPSLSTTLRNFAQLYFPCVFRRLKINVLDPEGMQYFIGLVEEAFRYRKETNNRRNDFLQLLLDLKKNEDSGVHAEKEEHSDYDPEDAIINQMHHVSGNEDKSVEKSKVFTVKTITAQALVFLTAGAEGASGTMNLFMFALATHPDVQKKLQNEVDQVLHKFGHWSYEMLKQITYIDQVMQETMRMYPASILLLRKCTKAYQLPDSDAVIEPGTRVIVPVYSLQFDPQYYPDPQKFDPDRWLDTNYKTNGRFLPFGDGPRICIAMRFALLEMKLCLAQLVAEYNVTLGSKTQIPLQFEKKSFHMIPKKPIWLTFEKRKTHISD